MHLVSDATTTTVTTVARASVIHFEGIRIVERAWSLVRSRKDVEEVIAGIEAEPGMVILTLVDGALRRRLEDACERLKVPCVPVIDPVVSAMAEYLGVSVTARTARQYIMDADYFRRIEAMKYVLAHDDGQAPAGLIEADVVIVGVSRTAKSPTCIYLANRGLKAANVPLVPDCPLPDEIIGPGAPLVVGLTKDPSLLVEIRKNRLRQLNETGQTDYIDLEAVSQEVAHARRLCTRHGWPLIDTTRRSVEEVAAAILQMVERRKRSQEAKP